jgi:hypothetical protein
MTGRKNRPTTIKNMGIEQKMPLLLENKFNAENAVA